MEILNRLCCDNDGVSVTVGVVSTDLNMIIVFALAPLLMRMLL